MAKTLIIAEKPSVAADIAAALGGFRRAEQHVFERDDCIVSSAIGHVAELHVPEADQSGAPLPIIPAQFDIRPTAKGKERLNLLKKLMQRSDVGCIVNACDAGREGELIFYLLYEYNRCQKPVKRMWLQSMTADSIRDGWRTMKAASEYAGLLAAARSRSEADWLVGINSSRAAMRLNTKLTGAFERLSAGRVQTPTLALVVRRDAAIRNFVPKDYWEVHAAFNVAAGVYPGKWMRQKKEGEEGAGEKGYESLHRLDSEEEALAIVYRCKGGAPELISETVTPVSKASPKLFDLTTLQREANTRHGFSAKQTLDLAQALYEKHKATSYPRTDSNCLPEDYVGKVGEILNSMGQTSDFGALAQQILQQGWLQADKRIFNNAKISDHFAIIPTGEHPVDPSREESQLYELIVRRFIAAFYPAAQYEKTVRLTGIGDDAFRSSGRVLKNEGWLAVYGHSASDDDKTPALCALNEGEPIVLHEVKEKALKTKPPEVFTEATLLSAMESAGKEIEDDALREAMSERGLGTPATRAPIIEGLLAKTYIQRQGKKITATDKGAFLISFLEQNGINELTSAEMTGLWEHKLALMAKGQYERKRFMEEIAQSTTGIVKIFKTKAGEATARVDAPACPDCGHALVRRASKFKKGEHYWSCSGYPECKTILSDHQGKPGEKKQAAVPSEHKCPQCGKPLAFKQGVGKRGPWKMWGCTGYPKCKTMLDDVDGQPVEKAATA